MPETKEKKGTGSSQARSSVTSYLISVPQKSALLSTSSLGRWRVCQTSRSTRTILIQDCAGMAAVVVGYPFDTGELQYVRSARDTRSDLRPSQGALSEPADSVEVPLCDPCIFYHRTTRAYPRSVPRYRCTSGTSDNAEHVGLSLLLHIACSGRRPSSERTRLLFLSFFVARTTR